MIGRIFCCFGWHDWGYRADRMITLRANSRLLARDFGNFYGFDYRCLRCGVKP